MTTPMHVRDVMAAPVVTAPTTATLEEAARLMVERGVGSVVVVSPDGPEKPVGIVTETDFEVTDNPVPFTAFRWPTAFGRYVWSEESMERIYAAARSQTVESVMSSPVESVAPGAELWEAVHVMLEREIDRLPVVEDGRLVGIVSRRDLLKCLLSRPPAASAS